MTQPIREVLNRKISDKHLAAVLVQLAGGLEETANFGSNILKQFAEVGTTKRHPIVFAMLLRHYLELLDAVSILVRQSSIEPSKLILRSMLEILFSFKYMFERDTELRASSFLIAQVSKVIAEFHKMTPTQIQSYPSWKSDIAELESELAHDEHGLAVQEHDRLVSLRKFNAPWYSYFDGPTNMKKLACYLDLAPFYETFYRQWSGPLHGRDVFSNRLDSDGRGGTAIVQIRFPRDAQLVTANAFTISIDLFQSFTEKLLPERLDQFRSWFQSMYVFGEKVNGDNFITTTIRPSGSDS